MAGANDTTTNPEVVPEGTVTLIELSLHEVTVIGIALRVTTLPACEDPKLEPEITNGLPVTPLVAETLEIMGAGAVDELTDTLSNVAVAKEVVLVLVTTNPT